MKSLIGALFLSLTIGSAAIAQTNEPKKNLSKPSRDHVLIQLSHDRWANVPDSIKMSNAGRGVGVYLMYDFPIKTSNFSFGAGIGVSVNNVYFNKQRLSLDSHTDRIVFDSTGNGIKGNKFTTTYLEAPLELRYFANKENRNKGFKFAIGAKVGFNGVGGAYYKERKSFGGKYINEKTATKRFNQTWRLSPMVRIGYGNFSVFAQYTVTPLFNAGTGPDVRPLSFGITISGL